MKTSIIVIKPCQNRFLTGFTLLRRITPIFLLFLLVSDGVAAQTKRLRGVISLDGKPVNRLAVFNSFDATYTDELGRYSLLLDDKQGIKPGDPLTIFTFKDSLGSSEQRCIIGTDYTYNFQITRKRSHIIIRGKVQNNGTGDGIPNINIAVISSNGYNTDPLPTDSFGLFSIPVALDQLENQNAVRLQVRDPLKKCKPLYAIPQLYEVGTFNIIEMEEENTHILNISRFTRTKICFQKGNIITLEAAGKIYVGNYVRWVGPEGKSTGLFDFPLDAYSIVSNITTSALMYRIAGDKIWLYAGAHKRFIASRDGCLEFEVNDADKSDNSGAYEVAVTITGR